MYSFIQENVYKAIPWYYSTTPTILSDTVQFDSTHYDLMIQLRCYEIHGTESLFLCLWFLLSQQPIINWFKKDNLSSHINFLGTNDTLLY